MLRRLLTVAAITALAVATTQDVRVVRQLDLGPPTNDLADSRPSNPPQNNFLASNPQQSNFQQTGYLPPIAPAAAQNDPVVLKPAAPKNPTHHGRDLCTDPFHSFLCDKPKPRRPITGALPIQKNFAESNGNSLFGANTFLEPSKVLAPPLNDLEDPITTTTTTRRPQPPPPTTTTTTTRRPPPPTTTTTTRRPPSTTTTTTTTERPIAPEPSNDIRTYLPPDNVAPAAAQNDPAIVKPPLEEEHHHHPHHHGRDLCTDPFHSFLCSSLKPRKRITGSLPNSLQGQNSFLDSRKIRPEPEVSPQPSNEIDRTYLPPSTRPPPPTTTRRPLPPPIVPAPSNAIDRAYLPPISTTRRPPPPTPPSTTRRPLPPPTTTIRFRPEPSNEINRAYLPPVTTTRRPTTTTTTTTTQAPIIPEPSNEIDRSYLPPDPKFEPAAAQNDLTVVRPDEEHHHHHAHHHGRDLCTDPFHSFLCDSLKPRKRITGDLPSRFRTNGLNPAPSNTEETRVRLLERKTDKFRVVVLPNDVETPQQSQQQVNKVPLPSNVSPGYDYPKPAPSNIGYSYPKPENRLPEPSNIQEVTGYDYPKPTTQLSTTTGYSYPKPDNKLTLPSERKEVVGYDYPKPSVPFPKPTEGYSYPKPDNRLTLPSEVKEVVGYDYPKPTTQRPTTTTRRTTTTQRVTTSTGYSYPKPENKLTLPSETKEVIGYDYPKPTVGLPLPEKGYNYPKPQVKLSLPTEDKPVIGYDYPKPTNSYNYPTPDQRLTLPTEKRNQVFTNAQKIANSYKIPTSSSKPLQLPASIQEARDRLQKEKKISNIGSQNTLSDFIPVNNVEFPSEGELGVKFGERLKRRERKYSNLVPPINSRRIY